MMAQSRWEVSIDELVRSFRDGICALIPIAERVRMSWKQPDAYDDWDYICAAIYHSIVLGSIENAFESGAFLPIIEYDRLIRYYEKNSFICDSYSEGRSAFVCFETETFPFDKCLFALLDSNLVITGFSRILASETRFAFFSRHQESGGGNLHDVVRVLL
jgi:hypothetical protein